MYGSQVDGAACISTVASNLCTREMSIAATSGSKQCRPKRLFILDVLDDVANIEQIIAAYILLLPLFEQLANECFPEIVDARFQK